MSALRTGDGDRRAEARHGTLFQDLSTPTVESAPRCRAAGIEVNRYHEAVAVQPATRAAVQSGGDLIREIDPFKEPHAFAVKRTQKLEG